jgi:hypothetical protein
MLACLRALGRPCAAGEASAGGARVARADGPEGAAGGWYVSVCDEQGYPACMPWSRGSLLLAEERLVCGLRGGLRWPPRLLDRDQWCVSAAGRVHILRDLMASDRCGAGDGVPMTHVCMYVPRTHRRVPWEGPDFRFM